MRDCPLIQFEIRIPGQEPKTVTMQEPCIKVGSTATADLWISHKSVQQMHADFQTQGDGVYVSDCGIAHGTFVNDQQIIKAKLNDGDVVLIGEVEVVVTFPEAVSARIENRRPRTLQDLQKKFGLRSDTHTPQEKTSKVYYCEQCFHVRAKIVMMQEGPTGDGDNRFHCPECAGEWKFNRGQARHVVSMKLQHYRTLAEELGILVIEDEVYSTAAIKIAELTEKLIKADGAPR